MRAIWAVLMCLSLGAAASAQEVVRTVSVTGVGSVEASPDIVDITLGVESRARSAAEALAENSASMADLLAVLSEAGVAEADVQTTNVSLYPQFEQRTPDRAPAVIGYVASNIARARIRDVAGVGSVLDAVARAGANRIQAIAFGLADRATQEDDARRAAVADAKRKASLYVEEAGVSLGALLSISEGGAPARDGPNLAFREAASPDAAIAGGSLTIRAEIQAVFAIE